jgi:hypothetical protein
MRALSIAGWFVACLPVTANVIAEDDLGVVGSEFYYSDSILCEADARSGILSGDWNGRHWAIVAPEFIDGSEPWHEKHRLGLYFRPLEILRGAVNTNGSFSVDRESERADVVVPSDGDVRLRLILVDPFTVTQEFSGSDRFVSMAVRMCVRRNGAWESVRFVSSRAVKGGWEFWHSDSPAVRQRDFSVAFRVALESAASWASRRVDGKWNAGTIERDPVYGR